MITAILKLKYLHHSLWFKFWYSISEFAITMMKLHHNEECKIDKRIKELEE